MSSIAHEVSGVDSVAHLLPAFSFDRLIHQDATGAVYRARHRSLDRDVAIRIVPSDARVDPHFRTAFQEDARKMARLAHPHLIRVYDCGDIDGNLYSVTEYVAGQSLLRCARGMAVDPEQAVGIIAAACRGLAHAHGNGVFHGQITPANILLNEKCEPKIGSFGQNECYRHGAECSETNPITYSAPETVRGQAMIGPQADVYSLGLILRELLTGVPTGTAGKGISDPGLDAICRKATHQDPASRFSDASSLADELDRWMAAAKSASKPARTLLASERPSAPVRRPTLSCPKPTHAVPRPSLSSTLTRRAHGNRFIATSCIVAAMTLGTGYLALHPETNGSQARQNKPSPVNSTTTGTATAPGDDRDATVMRLAKSE